MRKQEVYTAGGKTIHEEIRRRLASGSNQRLPRDSAGGYSNLQLFREIIRDHRTSARHREHLKSLGIRDREFARRELNVAFGRQAVQRTDRVHQVQAQHIREKFRGYRKVKCPAGYVAGVIEPTPKLPDEVSRALIRIASPEDCQPLLKNSLLVTRKRPERPPDSGPKLEHFEQGLTLERGNLSRRDRRGGMDRQFEHKEGGITQVPGDQKSHQLAVTRRQRAMAHCQTVNQAECRSLAADPFPGGPRWALPSELTL